MAKENDVTEVPYLAYGERGRERERERERGRERESLRGDAQIRYGITRPAKVQANVLSLVLFQLDT